MEDQFYILTMIPPPGDTLKLKLRAFGVKIRKTPLICGKPMYRRKPVVFSHQELVSCGSEVLPWWKAGHLRVAKYDTNEIIDFDKFYEIWCVPLTKHETEKEKEEESKPKKEVKHVPTVGMNVAPPPKAKKKFRKPKSKKKKAKGE